MFKKVYLVNSIEEYLETIRDINLEHQSHRLWYRGQEKSEFRLIPGIWREAYSVSDWRGDSLPISKTNFYNPKSERVAIPPHQVLLKMFKSRVENDDIVPPSNDVQWLELAQHYGLPTNLLDWSTDPLVGLFFAVSTVDCDNGMYTYPTDEEIYYYRDAERIENIIPNCASVWVINPLEINRILLNETSLSAVFQSSNPEDVQRITQEIEINWGTFCFEGSKINPRITRQSGNFTYSGTGVTHPLDFLSATQSEIIKINIPYNCIPKIMNDLNKLDITNESIYFGTTERDLAAREIKDEVYAKFHDYLNSLIE